MHPITYLDKILFGSKQGSIQLWNIKTAKQIYSFKSPKTLLQQVNSFQLILRSFLILFSSK
jgi:U3 small nucleolar RNA-associated protein 21